MGFRNKRVWGIIQKLLYRAFCKYFLNVLTPLMDLHSVYCDLGGLQKCQLFFWFSQGFPFHSICLCCSWFDYLFNLELDAMVEWCFCKQARMDFDHPICYFIHKHQMHCSGIDNGTLALLLVLQHFRVCLGSSSACWWLDHWKSIRDKTEMATCICLQPSYLQYPSLWY